MRSGEVLVIHGGQPKDMALRVLEESGLDRVLGRDVRVVLKPNLLAAKEASSGATTSPEVAEGVVEFLRRCGVKDITIAESSSIGCDTRKAFRACGYERLAQTHGLGLVDLKRDRFFKIEADGLMLEVSRTALEADLLIDLPVLKGHCQTRMSCAVKNLKGCISDAEKRRFHRLGLHRPIALLASVLKPQIVLVDALCGDLSFEEGGRPVRMDRLILGFDPVLVDSYGATLMGYDPGEIEHLTLASKLGAGSTDLARMRIRQIGKPAPRPQRPPVFLARLSRHVEAREACSACYGSLMHALERLRGRGLLDRLGGRIHVGQGFRGRSLTGLGVGSCTSGFDSNLPGCPPDARRILDFLVASVHA